MAILYDGLPQDIRSECPNCGKPTAEISDPIFNPVIIKGSLDYELVEVSFSWYCSRCRTGTKAKTTIGKQLYLLLCDASYRGE